jgi:hypothetical protein
VVTATLLAGIVVCMIRFSSALGAATTAKLPLSFYPGLTRQMGVAGGLFFASDRSMVSTCSCLFDNMIS